MSVLNFDLVVDVFVTVVLKSFNWDFGSNRYWWWQIQPTQTL